MRQIDDIRPYGDISIVHVADGLAALGAIAAAWRRRFDPLVVGITGSIAKTSTKEAVATVLGATRRTLKTEGNQNNEIGLPLTLLRLGAEDEAAVLEMGMYVSGEIADLAAMARPSIGVVTAVQAVHLSRIGSLEAIERAKGELLEALPSSGTAVLNTDDPIVDRMDRRTVARTLRYGFGEDADVRAVDVESAGTAGMRFSLRSPAGERPVATPRSAVCRSTTPRPARPSVSPRAWTSMPSRRPSNSAGAHRIASSWSGSAARPSSMTATTRRRAP